MDDPSEYGGWCAFCSDRLTLGPTLVCPVMVLWRDYCTYCEVFGFPQMKANRFVLFLERSDEIEIKESSSNGRLRRYVQGIGFKFPNIIYSTGE